MYLCNQIFNLINDMKKIYFISMVCAAVMFVSCGKKATLDSSIPNDAMMVMRFDHKSLVAKADYNLFKNPTIKMLIEVGKTKMSDSEKKLLEEFQKNPNSLGIDILGESYLFANQQVYGILLAVNDAKKVFKNLKEIDPTIESSVTQKNGVYSLNEDGFQVSWNKEKMIILLNYSQILGAKATEEVDYFNLPKEKSIISDVNYKKFAAAKGDISMYYSMSNYVGFMGKFANLGEKLEMEESAEMKEIFNKMAAIYENFDGIATMLNCNFEKGKIVSKMQMLYATKEAEQKYNEFYNYADAKLTGEFFKYIPENPLFLFAMDFDGEKILAMFEKLGLISLYDELLKKLDANFEFDYKALINSIKGDVMFSAYNLSTTSSTFRIELAAFAKLSNPDAVKPLLDIINAKMGETENKLFDFGIKDDFFYITEKGGLVERENSLTKKINKQPMFLYGDLTGLNESLKPFYEQNYQMFSSVITKGLTLVETYESKYIDKDNFECVVNFSDKKQNSLKQFFCFIDQVINNAAMMAGSAFGGGNAVADDAEEVEEVEF